MDIHKEKNLFEKFTQVAVDVVIEAQFEACSLKHKKVYPEHFLLGFLSQKYCYACRLLNIANINSQNLRELIKEKLNSKKTTENSMQNVSFSFSAKSVLNNAISLAKIITQSYVTPEHIFIALLEYEKSYMREILTQLGFDVEKNKALMYKLIKRNKKTENIHPEEDFALETKNENSELATIFEDFKNSSIFNSAMAKLTASNYEILGTEQIMQSILEDKSSELTQILNKTGLSLEKYLNKLSEITNRNEEFEEKQIVLTPNALKTLIVAYETAKEFGDLTIMPQHFVLSLLKSKKGIAYRIMKELNVDFDLIASSIIKPIERQMNEVTTIMRLAHEEAYNLGQNIVGTELILLGIVAEGTSIAAKVLLKLGVNLKEIRTSVEKLVTPSDDYASKNLKLSERAKNVLSLASKIAREYKFNKIRPEHLLLAITQEPKSVAMRILNDLGVDVLEIKFGITKELEK